MAKRGNPEHPEHLENSELEVMRAKIRKLEESLKESLIKNELLQVTKNDQVDHHEELGNGVIDFLSEFMSNHGFKRIADKILSALDCGSFNRCRLVCRPWKNYIDNEWSMLQLQIFHLKRHPGEIDEDGKPYYQLLNEYMLNFGSLIKIMEKTTNKSELRVFIQMCRELVSKRCGRRLGEDPLEYMIDHHRHQELEMLLHCPIQKNPDSLYCGFRDFTKIFKYACQFGCEICVKLLLDRSEEKEIDLNKVQLQEEEKYHRDPYQFEHCLFVANFNCEGYRKDVVDLLLRCAEAKGIDIHTKRERCYHYFGVTLRDEIIKDYEECITESIEDYTEETYKILKIDPSVDLKRK